MNPWKLLEKKLFENAGRCNCENGACEKLGDHKPGDCHRPAGKVKALYLGSLCDICAEYMPDEYLLPPHGSAKNESPVGGGGAEDGEAGEPEEETY